ncbi:phage major capsid protein [Mangrovicoccus ximenensis]|uniref:phage major capsid protein n=1 Tax=Mangrovicoccus ximenensis TaxID=1911570 RepID=UPI000D331735|nr:phage major capsid protein [Mangrovicoccus ximenensis]
MVSPGWVMRASTKAWIAELRDANGNLLFPEVKNGTLKGFPIHTSSNVPNSLGTGTDETEIYFADFDKMMIGETASIVLDQSTEASFTAQGGTETHAFQQDMTLFRAIAEHDFAPEYDVAVTGFNAAAWSL